MAVALFDGELELRQQWPAFDLANAHQTARDLLRARAQTVGDRAELAQEELGRSAEAQDIPEDVAGQLELWIQELRVG